MTGGNCDRCPHAPHTGRMCGAYNTVDIRDDVSFGGFPPSGWSMTLIESVCHCITVGVL